MPASPAAGRGEGAAAAEEGSRNHRHIRGRKDGQPPPRVYKDEAAQLLDYIDRAENWPRKKDFLLKMPIHQLCHEQISTVFFFHCKKGKNLSKLVNF